MHNVIFYGCTGTLEELLSAPLLCYAQKSIKLREFLPHIPHSGYLEELRISFIFEVQKKIYCRYLVDIGVWQFPPKIFF